MGRVNVQPLPAKYGDTKDMVQHRHVAAAGSRTQRTPRGRILATFQFTQAFQQKRMADAGEQQLPKLPLPPGQTGRALDLFLAVLAGDHLLAIAGTEITEGEAGNLTGSHALALVNFGF